MRARCGLPAAILVILAAWPAAAAEGDAITSWLWLGRGGPESFYWEVWPDGDGFGGVVHTVRDGKKQTELPVDQVVWEAPDLELHMDTTGVVFRGRLVDDGTRIEGRLHFGGEEGPEFNLERVDPASATVLAARGFDAVPWAYRVPAAKDDGWIVGDAAAHGLPHATVVTLVDRICAGDAGVIHSLLLVAGGELVVEEYFHGYGPADVHRLASVTKSVSSLLTGVAVDRGAITGVEVPVMDFFPDLEPSADHRWRDITLHHLLSMSMGLDWGPDEDPHGTGPAFFGQVLGRRIVHAPGTRWAYHSANVNLLAGVLREATGLHADAFAERHLFTPLGITDYDWSFMATDGYRLMDGSLQLRPRDMAKLGMLVRGEGRWRGEQIVSTDWIRRSVSRQIDTDGPEGYGYLWWLGNLGEDLPVVLANGHGSQFIGWLPDRDLIIVVTGGNEDNGKHFAIVDLLSRAF
ncbi:MAG: serine hydrolase [bacterium]|nr:serine hydrolase [bacterium]